MWECAVCKNSFDLTELKDEVYVGYECKGLAGAFSGNKRFDCVDCPKCSCQNVLCERLRELGAADDEDGDDVTETITNDEDEATEAGEKTRLDDCAACWCNTCANIEKCIDADEGQELVGVRPFPCAECSDGVIYVAKKEGENCPCVGYVQGEENNG